jgi:hypothetical protein
MLKLSSLIFKISMIQSFLFYFLFLCLVIIIKVMNVIIKISFIVIIILKNKILLSLNQLLTLSKIFDQSHDIRIILLLLTLFS